MRPYLASIVLVSTVLACGDEDRDSGIYSSSGNSFDGADDDSDEVADADESTTTGESSDDATTNETSSESSDSSSDGSSDGSSTDGSTSDDTTSTEGGETCGNGVIDPGEQCDGGNLAGSSCSDLGFVRGVLACDPGICVFDTSGCTNEGPNDCDNNCNGCTCPSFECTMCCAVMDKIDVCSGGQCAGCF